MSAHSNNPIHASGSVDATQHGNPERESVQISTLLPIPGHSVPRLGMRRSPFGAPNGPAECGMAPTPETDRPSQMARLIATAERRQRTLQDRERDELASADRRQEAGLLSLAELDRARAARWRFGAEELGCVLALARSLEAEALALSDTRR